MNPIVRLLPNNSTFHSQKKKNKKRIHFTVNTKSKNTEKQQCVHLGVRDSASTNLLSPGITLTSLLTNQNVITVDSKRTEQKLIRLSQMFEPEQKHHQM